MLQDTTALQDIAANITGRFTRQRQGIQTCGQKKLLTERVTGKSASVFVDKIKTETEKMLVKKTNFSPI